MLKVVAKEKLLQYVTGIDVLGIDRMYPANLMTLKMTSC